MVPYQINICSILKNLKMGYRNKVNLRFEEGFTKKKKNYYEIY